MESGLYVPDEIDREAERASEGCLVQAAADVARRSQLASGTDQTREFAIEMTDAGRKAAYFSSLETIRPIETTAVREWVARSDLFLDDAEFQRHWKEGREQHGTENDVYFDDASQLWFKRNNLSHHGTWLEYFQRLQLHDYLFREAPLTLEGFVMHQGELLPIASQRTVRAIRGATVSEVRDYMNALGFARVADPTRRYDYVNEATGIRADDLHDENVLIVPGGNIVVIDPSPSMSWETKMRRLRAKYL